MGGGHRRESLLSPRCSRSSRSSSDRCVFSPTPLSRAKKRSNAGTVQQGIHGVSGATRAAFGRTYGVQSTRARPTRRRAAGTHREYLTPDGTSTPTRPDPTRATRPDPTARRSRQAARSTRPQGPYLHTGETRAGTRATPTVACNHKDKPLHTQTQEMKQDSRRWLLLKFRMQVRCMPVRYGGKRGYAPFAPVPVPLQVPSS